MCTLWNSDKAVEGGQVGLTVVVGCHDGFCLDDVKQFTIVAQRVDVEVANLEVQADVLPVRGGDDELLSQTE